MTFKKAVKATYLLEHAYEKGLEALRAEDKPHIEAEDTRKILGSVDIDNAYVNEDPNGNRWDFAIGYQHSSPKHDVVYWVELHTASDSQVKVVIKKAQWLLSWLKGHGKELAKFEREIIWVSSGATRLTPSATQKKQMAQSGLKQVGNRLRIKNKRPHT